MPVLAYSSYEHQSVTASAEEAAARYLLAAAVHHTGHWPGRLRRHCLGIVGSTWHRGRHSQNRLSHWQRSGPSREFRYCGWLRRRGCGWFGRRGCGGQCHHGSGQGHRSSGQGQHGSSQGGLRPVRSTVGPDPRKVGSLRTEGSRAEPADQPRQFWPAHAAAVPGKCRIHVRRDVQVQCRRSAHQTDNQVRPGQDLELG